MGLTNFPHGLTTFGVPLYGAGNDYFSNMGGNSFFVENNSGNDGNDGKTWETAFKTLAKGIAVCQADITDTSQKYYARRNKLYISGDAIEENIVLLPEKTDIIGCGQCDGLSPARVKGNWVPATRSTTGVRFFNIAFHAATGVIFTLTNNQPGISFYGCEFLAGASTTIAVLATGVPLLRISGCDFKGFWDSQFSTAAIDIAIGLANGQVIEYCNIENNPIGVRVIITKTGGACIARYNNFNTVGCTMIDSSNTWYTLGNQFCSAAATGAASLSVNVLKACGNWYRDATKCGNYPVTA